MSHKNFVERVCAALARNGGLTPEQARSLAQQFGGKARLDFEEFVVQEGLVGRRKLLEALSAVYKVPSFDVTGYFFDHYLVRRFDKEFLKRNMIIPLSVDDDEIIVMIAAVPNDVSLAEEVMRYVSWEPAFLVGMYQDIEDAIDEFYDNALTVDPLYDELSDQERDERLREEQAERIIRSTDVADQE